VAASSHLRLGERHPRRRRRRLAARGFCGALRTRQLVLELRHLVVARERENERERERETPRSGRSPERERTPSLIPTVTGNTVHGLYYTRTTVRL
jgi:hypothetical protein